MFVLLPSETHKTRKYGTTAWTKQSTAESLSGASKYERGVPRSRHKKASNAESNMTGGSYKIHEITGRQIENSQIKMIGTSLTGGKNKEKIINLK
ncbi:MAG: hypothetical protein J6M37_06600 [Prevotella sp.]|nr:hypothetical protein [Prevotella sp.]